MKYFLRAIVSNMYKTVHTKILWVHILMPLVGIGLAGKTGILYLMLLDVMMPNKDGFTFCREVRNSVDCPILFITAKTLDKDLEFGFSVGADDYIKKPFSITELRARVSAHLRRQSREHHTQLVNGKFRFNLSARELYYEDKLIKLTKSEYRICEFLIQNRGQVFSLEQIIEKVFGYDAEIGAICLFLLVLIFIVLANSLKFGKQLKKEINPLLEEIAQIKEKDLEIIQKSTKIKEFNAVLTALNDIEKALAQSLQTEWETDFRKVH